MLKTRALAYNSMEVSDMAREPSGVSVSRAKTNLRALLIGVIKRNEVVRILNDKGNAVIMSGAEYDNLMENVYVRSNPYNYRRILESIGQLETGACASHELFPDG